MNSTGYGELLVMVNPLIVLFPVNKNGTYGEVNSIIEPVRPFKVTLLLKTFWVEIEYVPAKTLITPFVSTVFSASSIVWKGLSLLPSPPGSAFDSTNKLYGFGSIVPVGPVGPVAPVGPGTKHIGIFCI